MARTRCETFTRAEPSVEGTAVTGLHIHVGEAGGSRNGVLLLGGVPARELMNPDAIVWLIPCSNPHGRDYVMTSDYMWRKNRRPETGPLCPGGAEPWAWISTG